MALRLGDITFGVGADTSGLDKAIKKLDALGARLDVASRRTSDAGKKMAAAYLRQEKALTSSLTKALNLQARLAAQKAPIDTINRTTKAYDKLVSTLSRKQGPASEKELSRAMARFREEIAGAEREWNNLKTTMKSTGTSSGLAKAEKEAQALEDALLSAELRMKRVNRTLSKQTGTDAAISGNKQAFSDLEDVYRRFGKDSSQGREAMRTFKRSLDNAFGDDTAEHRINRLNTSIRNLNSAFAVILGPLSGIGARVSAFSSVFLRADVAAGVFITSIVAAGAAVGALSYSSVKLELEMGRLEARFIALENLGGRGVAQTFKEIGDLADFAGTKFVTTAEGFSRLEAAAAGTRLEGARVRQIFDDMTEGAARFQLTDEQLGGTLKALEQIMSKGTVQAEELRGQLGDRLPGAFQIAARAMGVTTQELNKMLKKGEVLSEDFLPKFASEFKRTFSGTGQVNTLQADLNRLSNAFLKIRKAFDDATGTSDKFQEAVKSTTEIIITLAENMDTLIGAAAGLTAAIGVGLASAIAIIKWEAISSGIATTWKLMITLAGAVRTAAVSMYQGATAANALSVASARLSSALASMPWVTIAATAAAAIATIATGIGTFKSVEKRLSDGARAARDYGNDLEAVIDKYQRVRELDPSATPEQLAQAFTDSELPIKNITARIQETQQKLNDTEVRVVELKQAMAELTKQTQVSGVEYNEYVSALLEASDQIDYYKSALIALETDLAVAEKSQKDLGAETKKTGDIFDKEARRQIDILRQQADALYESEAAFAAFSNKESMSDDLYNIIKDTAEALQLTDTQARAVADAFTGVENSTAPEVFEEFERYVRGTDDALDDIPGKLREIGEGLGRIKTGDFSVFSQIDTLFKEMARSADPLVQKLRELFPAVDEANDALERLAQAKRVRAMEDFNRELSRTKAQIDLIGKPEGIQRLAEAQFNAEDAARSLEKELTSVGYSTSYATARAEELKKAMMDLAGAEIARDLNQQLDASNFQLSELIAQMHAASQGDLALAQFDRFAGVRSQVQGLKQDLERLYNGDELTKKTQEWTDALYGNARALFELQRTIAVRKEDEELQAMLDFANAAAQGTQALNRLNREYAAVDAVRQYADQIRQTARDQDDFNKRLLAFASAYDVTENFTRATSGITEWSQALEDYGIGAVDAFSASIADMFANFKFSADGIRSAAKSLAADLTQTWLNLVLANPIKNQLFGTDLATLSGQGATSLFGGAFGGFGKNPEGTATNAATSEAANQIAQTMGTLDTAAMSAANSIGSDLATSAASAATQAGSQALAASSEAAAAGSVTTALIAMNAAITAATTALTAMAAATSASGAADAATAFLADGGVLGKPFMAAKGTVLDRATYFPKFNTIGGEAGPEGLLPLSRTSDGKLGVHAVGANNNSPPQQNTYNFGDIIIPEGANPRAIKKSLTQALQSAERSSMSVKGNVGGM